MLAALLPKPDGAGCPWDSTHAEPLPQQTDPPPLTGTGESAPGGSPGHNWHLPQPWGLAVSPARGENKAGHGVEAQTPVAGQPGFQT